LRFRTLAQLTAWRIRKNDAIDLGLRFLHAPEPRLK
jgi:hypothetical protein